MATYQLILLLALCLLNVGDHPGASWEFAYNQAVEWFNHAEFDNARAAADRGYRSWRGHPQSRAYWRFRLALAESLIELDRTQEAIPLLESSAPFPEDEARRLADQALVHLRNHQDEETVKCIARARLDLPPTARDLAGKIDLIDGTLQLQRGQMSAAEVSFERALASVEGSHSLIEAYTLADLGFLDHRRFRYDESLYWFGRTRDLARSKGMRRALDLALGNIASDYLDLGDMDRAAENFTNATTVAEQLHDRVYEMRWLVGLGETWEESGDLEKAAGSYRKAQALADPERDREWLSNVLHDLAGIALKKGDLPSAGDLNAHSTELARQSQSSPALLRDEVQLADISVARHDYLTGESTYNQTLIASQRAHDPVDAFKCHVGLSGLYRQTGATAKAESEFRATLAAADQLHSTLQRDESKFSFLSALVEFYRDYVDFLVDKGDPAAAFRVAESSRAQVLEERLHRDESSAPAADLTSLKKEAGTSGAILMSYWLAPRRSLLWVIDSAGLHSFQLPPEAEIAAQVRRYNDAIQRGDNPIEGGNDAGRWLFANLLGSHYRVPKNSNVVIEPDSVLHQLSFESLPAEDGGHYWIDDATVSVAPSLALLQRSEYASGGRLLAFGDPGYEGTEFQRLSNAKAELQAVESHFTDKAVYVASAATPAAYRAAHPETFSTLHFASHAVANRESPLDSAIVLAGPPDSRKLYAREILERRLTAELVTLSACQTAGSRTYYGEGLTGFSWAFLSAGARNVVAGLWDVDDRATAELMKDFYDELGAGPAPVSALRRAKLRLIASGGAYRKPRYWAAFETFTRAIYQVRFR
jgi:CHAT domain-containing protein/tetratricopeptide (TPR) repeat protein